MADDYITFLPHLIRDFFGVSGESSESDHLAGSLNLSIAQDLSGAPISHPLEFRGPGDILGIHPRMIARIEPPPGTNDFEPNYFAFIEFVDPDLMWRYSLEPTGNIARAHPWLSLIVLTSDEIGEIEQSTGDVISRIHDGRELLSIRGDLIPTLDTAWALAHVHLNGDIAEDDIETFIDQNSNANCSRLFCARHLQPETRYHAFLVPNYLAAVHTALGITDSTAGSAKAWDDSQNDIVQLPIYFRWEFTTSEKGDFEDLARKLSAAPIDPDRVGTRAVDATLLQASNGSEVPFFMREGALAAPGFSISRNAALPVSSAIESLRTSLNAALASDPQYAEEISDDIDPLVTFPVYGRYYQKTESLEKPTSDTWSDDTPWISELNLDFRNRTAGGMGTTVVQQNQDKYAKTCWSQVGQIREANELRRLSLSAHVIGKALERKHVESLPDERFVQVTRPFHDNLYITDGTERRTFRRALEQSGLISGALSPTLARVANRRIGANRTRPFDPWTKAKNPSIAARLKKKHSVSLTHLSGAVNVTGIKEQVFQKQAEVVTVEPLALDTVFRSAVDLEQALLANLADRIHVNSDEDDDSDGFDPIMRAPAVDDPTYAPLAEISQDYILPGVEALQNNGVTLMEENHRFIESYLIGVNHEMIRELVWQRFPTDKRATVFKYFWDPVAAVDADADIDYIHRWHNPLGKNEAVQDGSNLVLVIKGDLIKRYPGTIIYAVRLTDKQANKWQYWSQRYPDDQPPEIDEDLIIDPVFRAHIGVDILFAGFPFTLENIQGAASDGQYYFVLEENQDLPRFGLDVQSFGVRKPNLVLPAGAVFADANVSVATPVSGTTSIPIPNAGSAITNSGFEMADVGSAGNGESVIGDLGWNDIPDTHMKSGYINQFDTIGSNSAEIAHRTYQKPIRVLIHSSHMLTEKDIE